MIAEQDKPLEDEKPVQECKHLEELMREQVKVINRHIEKHKYYHGIDDRSEAIVDFIDKYRWLLREVFCDMCPENKICQPYRSYLKDDPEIDHGRQT